MQLWQKAPLLCHNCVWKVSSMDKTHPVWVFAFLFVVGCQWIPTPAATTPQPTGQITAYIVPIEHPSPTPAICTDLPGDAKLIVTPVSSTQIQIDLTGMQPGESLVFLFVAQPTPGHTGEIESRPQEVVGQDGSFTITEGSLTPLPGNTLNTWTVKVIHSRGVACQDVTLP